MAKTNALRAMSVLMAVGLAACGDDNECVRSQSYVTVCDRVVELAQGSCESGEECVRYVCSAEGSRCGLSPVRPENIRLAPRSVLEAARTSTCTDAPSGLWQACTVYPEDTDPELVWELWCGYGAYCTD
jgi:hypothetical protein